MFKQNLAVFLLVFSVSLTSCSDQKGVKSGNPNKFSGKAQKTERNASDSDLKVGKNSLDKNGTKEQKSWDDDTTSFEEYTAENDETTTPNLSDLTSQVDISDEITSVGKNGVLDTLRKFLPGFTEAYGQELPDQDLSCPDMQYLAGIKKDGSVICKPIIISTTNNQSSVTEMAKPVEFRHVRATGGNSAEACCESNEKLTGCSGSRHADAGDSCDEDECGYIGTIVTNNGSCCRTGIDTAGGTTAVAYAFCSSQ